MKRQRDVYLAWSGIFAFLFILSVALVFLDLFLIKPKDSTYVILFRSCFVFGYGAMAVLSFWFRGVLVFAGWRCLLITLCFQTTVVGIFGLEHLAGGLASRYSAVIIQTALIMAVMLYKFPKLLFVNLTLMCSVYISYHLFSSEIDPKLRNNILSGIVSCYAVGSALSVYLFRKDWVKRKKEMMAIVAEGAFMHGIRGPLNHIHNLSNELQRNPEKAKELSSRTAEFTSFIMTIQSGVAALKNPTNESTWGISLGSAILHSRIASNNIVAEISQKCLTSIINVDPSLLPMLIANLADNAGKYAKDSRLYLWASLSKNSLTLITKTFPINTSDFEHLRPRRFLRDRKETIAEMSIRLCRGSTNRSTGFGLHIVNGILEQAGGSAAVGLEETTALAINVTLPLKKYGLGQIRFAEQAKIKDGAIIA